MSRGIKVYNTGKPITVPVGPELLGRIINVVGNEVDGRGKINTKEYMPIHREAPGIRSTSRQTRKFLLPALR